MFEDEIMKSEKRVKTAQKKNEILINEEFDFNQLSMPFKMYFKKAIKRGML